MSKPREGLASGSAVTQSLPESGSPPQVMVKRIGLVGCVSKKRDVPLPARELYVSALFLGRRSMVERTCTSWFILSAKHGVLSPDDVVAPYDQTLKNASAVARRAWSETVLRSLDAVVGSLAGVAVEIHAGAEYRGYGVESGLKARGADIVVPTVGLPIGRQLAFYKRERDKALISLPGT